jgi:Ca2+/H+ antiporter
MKGRIFILLAILMITCVSLFALITDVRTDTDIIKESEIKQENVESQEEDNTTLSNSSFPKSKLTLAILFLGGVGLAIFRKNSFL